MYLRTHLHKHITYSFQTYVHDIEVHTLVKTCSHKGMTNYDIHTNVVESEIIGNSTI